VNRRGAEYAEKTYGRMTATESTTTEPAGRRRYESYGKSTA